MAVRNSTQKASNLARLTTDGVFDPSKFWLLVAVGDGCWEWQGIVETTGYGLVTSSPSSIGAPDRSSHRASWKLTRGPIPVGICVLHHCDNRKCCRPDHLFLGTKGDNNRDTAKKGRFRPVSKLTAQQARVILALRGQLKIHQISAQFKISRSVIQRIWYRKAWKNVA